MGSKDTQTPYILNERNEKVLNSKEKEAVFRNSERTSSTSLRKITEHTTCSTKPK